MDSPKAQIRKLVLRDEIEVLEVRLCVRANGHVHLGHPYNHVPRILLLGLNWLHKTLYLFTVANVTKHLAHWNVLQAVFFVAGMESRAFVLFHRSQIFFPNFYFEFFSDEHFHDTRWLHFLTKIFRIIQNLSRFTIHNELELSFCSKCPVFLKFRWIIELNTWNSRK